MPRRCTACKMVGGKGHSLHLFPKVEKFRRLWVSAVKLHRKDFDGATPTSLLCSRHFTEDWYVIEGQRYRDECAWDSCSEALEAGRCAYYLSKAQRLVEHQ